MLQVFPTEPMARSPNYSLTEASEAELEAALAPFSAPEAMPSAGRQTDVGGGRLIILFVSPRYRFTASDNPGNHTWTLELAHNSFN